MEEPCLNFDGERAKGDKEREEEDFSAQALKRPSCYSLGFWV